VFEGYAPASGEIVGILKTMHDEMSADIAEEKAAEEAAIKAYDELMAAKTKEVNALTKAIEEKMTRSGELAVEIVQMKNDLGDTAEALVEDKKFLADLEKNCATKTAEWEEIVKTRNEELLALSDTIKVLNDDDALELFKKALPGASSFVQMEVSTSALRARALAAIRSAPRSTHLDFIAMAIQGKKIGFEKVITMIDEMVSTLKTEQNDDDHKKEYCAADGGQGTSPQGGCAHFHLHEAACPWQSFLEKFQSVVVIENFDCVAEGKELLIARLYNFFPLGCLRGTIFLEVSKEFLIFN
jgi:hypothetical protein